jgi:putative endonuclease
VECGAHMEGQSRGGGEKRSALQKAFWRGHYAEYLAAACLAAKGHRILVRRYKTHVGEIDIIAKRGRRIVFIEVKYRTTIEDCHAAVTPQTRRRVRGAADLWLARQERFQNFDLGFDLIFVVPRRWPVHLINAL